MNWSEFDKKVDVQGLSKDVKEAKTNDGEYPEVPQGKYVVELEALELKESKKGHPMLFAKFKILEGKFEKFKLFMNQVIFLGDEYDAKIRIPNANKFLKSLETEYAVDFESFAQYAELIKNIADECVNCEFQLKYGVDKKGYNTFEIVEAY